MTISIANNALSNCNSLDQVVELINDDMATDAERFVVAAAYAIDSCEDQDDITNEELEAHLELLTDAGAEFDSNAAFRFAKANIIGKKEKLIESIDQAESLVDLCESLNNLEEYLKDFNQLDNDFLKIDECVDLTDLKTFGNKEPKDTMEIYSWDDERCMISSTNTGDNWVLVERTEDFGL